MSVGVKRAAQTQTTAGRSLFDDTPRVFNSIDPCMPGTFDPCSLVDVTRIFASQLTSKLTCVATPIVETVSN